MAALSEADPFRVVYQRRLVIIRRSGAIVGRVDSIEPHPAAASTDSGIRNGIRSASRSARRQ